jgi:hypothetical protein
MNITELKCAITEEFCFRHEPRRSHHEAEIGAFIVDAQLHCPDGRPDVLASQAVGHLQAYGWFPSKISDLD